ncbi:hypothetical protein [Sphingomonas sp. BK580]|uniref:hypothetical protein n=1 Tax=Sphingomonas sp. BK580 TaxID=2586972 RepID=UPI001616738B|nr:hypothetical protein [Sphingomonas sp. BK580]MBB3693605.1 hypothetical protein [Sphingomonas sp. BK580]
MRDGWIDHAGEGRPLPFETRVRVRLRSGKVMRVARAGSRNWEHAALADPAYQIVQYEVVTNDEPSEI